MKKNRQKADPKMFSGDPLDHVLHAGLAIEHQVDHDKNHDHRQDLIEEVTANVYGNLCPYNGADHGRQSKIDAVGKGVDAFASKSGNRKDVLDENGHPIRAVGDRRGKTQENEHRQG